jgi:hypothetical protein
MLPIGTVTAPEMCLFGIDACEIIAGVLFAGQCERMPTAVVCMLRARCGHEGGVWECRFTTIEISNPASTISGLCCASPLLR